MVEEEEVGLLVITVQEAVAEVQRRLAHRLPRVQVVQETAAIQLFKGQPKAIPLGDVEQKVAPLIQKHMATVPSSEVGAEVECMEGLEKLRPMLEVPFSGLVEVVVEAPSTRQAEMVVLGVLTPTVAVEHQPLIRLERRELHEATVVEMGEAEEPLQITREAQAALQAEAEVVATMKATVPTAVQEPSGFFHGR